MANFYKYEQVSRAHCSLKNEYHWLVTSGFESCLRRVFFSCEQLNSAKVFFLFCFFLNGSAKWIETLLNAVLYGLKLYSMLVM